MQTAKAMRDLDGMFKTTASAETPSAEARHRKPSGNGDQRTNED
ncbi:hypothetical protein [Streptomyces werraensis]